MTKSSLQQRMLDLESEKVKPAVPSSPPAGQMESEYLHFGLCNLSERWRAAKLKNHSVTSSHIIDRGSIKRAQ